MGSVEIDIVNKNVFDSSIFKSITKDGVTITNKNGIITLNGTYTGTENWNYIFNIPTLKGNYILSINQMGGSQTLIKGNGLRFSLWEKDFSNVWVSIENQNFNKTLSGHSYIQASLLVFKGASFNNLKINLQVERNTKATAYVQHQSQTAIMPIQQEMLEGDYVADIEHHTWGKIVLTGNEKWNISGAGSNTQRFDLKTSELKLTNIDDASIKICNYFNYSRKNIGVWGNFYLSSNFLVFTDNDNIISTIDNFKTFLKQQYDSENPIIIYYKLAEPVDLELTEEQKEVKKRKLYTYEDITNVSLSDELASCKLTYVQDVKKLLEKQAEQQNARLDNIEALLSTTETSALLLDNMQTDLAKEVE